tara:strand:+ start:4300 stop:5331 length:1032 start_codon:yes stop_codon:yes gene_type:complete
MSASMMQQFDVFARVVASGNIAVSAQELDLPVATVVTVMNRLEDRLGFRLFSTENGLVELTPAGHKAVSVLADLSLKEQEQWVERLANGGKGGETQEEETPPPVVAPPSPEAHEQPDEAPTPKHFRPQDLKRPHRPAEPVQSIVLASHPGIFSHFQEALTAFEQASPDIGITLRLASLDMAQLRALFTNKLADIAYFYTLDGEDDLGSRYAWSERISLFTGKDYALAHLDSAMAEDLANIPYVALAPGNSARILAEQALAAAGLRVGKPVLETDDLYQIMKHVVAEGSYFAAFGPLARDFGKMGGIARLAYAQGLPQVHVRQAVRPDLADDPAVLALAEFLFR